MYAQFCLRRNQQFKAEHYIQKVIVMRNGEISRELHILLAALLLQRKDYRGCKTHLDAVLDENWTDMHANLLFGFFYSAIGWPEMARKYFAIGKV